MNSEFSQNRRIYIDELDTTGMDVFKGYSLVENRRVKLVDRRKSEPKKNQWKGLHHNPPTFRIEFVPTNLEKLGLKFDGLVQESEVDKYSISRARLAQQVEFWNNPVLDETTINSLVVTSIFKESPYEYFDYRDEGPMIGIFKRSGNTKGQAVWINLIEAQILIKLFIYLLNRKIAQLTSTSRKKQVEFNLQFNQQSCFYDPVNFIDLGVSRDFVVTGPAEDVKLEELVEKLTFQQENFVGGDVVYPVGSIDVLHSEINSAQLFALLKKRGSDAGQRIWFSCHELQHLLQILVQRVKLGIAQLQRDING
ncbi:uncharacterized protein LOC118436028 [Folsomia candida]|uniref:Uncharacterized protein n=1 Tax=Folsomia candida TaxID=158441 RepID=A0A226E7M8_FOLCA|nr:uncharacterized protein LOC118436028 [Folsomia candida]OXA53328.1 hypothetical protein Fcan01_12830 [Folsomia candida]